jgi:hypothetical protein
LDPARGVASRTVPGSPSRETVRGTPRLGSGTQAAIGQRRRRPVKSEGAPCYAFRARRFRGCGGPCYKPGRGHALGETTRCLSSNGPPTVLTRILVSSGIVTDPRVLVPRPGRAFATYRADRVLPNDSRSGTVLPRVASVPVPFVAGGELVVPRRERT